MRKADTLRQRDMKERHLLGIAPAGPRGFPRPQTITIPTDPATLGYLAGIVDGEGSITKSKGKTERLLGWRVAVGMTDEAIIRWLATFGGTVRNQVRTPPQKEIFLWRVLAQNDVLALLHALVPYLRVKRDRALECISEIESRQAHWAAIESQHETQLANARKAS